MRSSNRTEVHNSVFRIAVTILAILLQLGWLILMFVRLNRYSMVINCCVTLLAAVLVLHIYGKHWLSAFKLPWIILMLVAPLLGVCLYAMFGQSQALAPMRWRFNAYAPRLRAHAYRSQGELEALAAAYPAAVGDSRYLADHCAYPLLDKTDVRFYPEASEGFEAQLEDMRHAERFIFLEYHAIEEGAAFARMKEILADRAAHGVEVRILYDEVGSMGFIDRGFIKRMEACGIACRVFNPVKPVLSLFMNNRDHRKITVIDGRVGFTGGYNLADEYFNLTHPYGYWKDTGLRLEGRAVSSLTMQFLEMWNAVRDTDKDVATYLPDIPCTSGQGFVQPYADSPLDELAVGENVYLNLISRATQRLWLATPYLIISDEMTRALTLAAQRGVDVRVITPGIPDKKLIYSVTRSYYAALARGGVRVYEYTPGFLHEKQLLCDNTSATVGTINFDYRSLYHHFENGVLLHGCPCIDTIAEDFEKTLAVSREVTEAYRTGRNAVLRVKQCIWRLFAPLL